MTAENCCDFCHWKDAEGQGSAPAPALPSERERSLAPWLRTRGQARLLIEGSRGGGDRQVALWSEAKVHTCVERPRSVAAGAHGHPGQGVGPIHAFSMCGRGHRDRITTACSVRLQPLGARWRLDLSERAEDKRALDRRWAGLRRSLGVSPSPPTRKRFCP